MNEIETLVDAYDARKLSRRDLIAALGAIALPVSRDTGVQTSAVSQVAQGRSLNHASLAVSDVAAAADFYQKVLGFKVSDWIDDFFVFMRCNADHHTVNFIRGKNIKMHHMAFELKDFIHLQNSCDLFGQRKIPIIWGPLRHGPGHNVATYHRNQDEQVVEFYCELDQMKDEELGYFEPRPWHHDTPQRPKRWTPGHTSVWGPPPTPDFHRTQV